MFRELLDAWMHWPIGCAPVYKALPLVILMSTPW